MVKTTTTITEENYALAESDIIFKDYSEKIIKANTAQNKDYKDGGIGILFHQRKGMDPMERSVMRPNFDTLYSFIILDFGNNNQVEVTMPPTDNGRYQSGWIITNEHYNPFAMTHAGKFQVNKENCDNVRYVMIAFRTQVNMNDEMDLTKAHECQNGIEIQQSNFDIKKNGGISFIPSQAWDYDEILQWRAKYQTMVNEEDLKAEDLFGAKTDEKLTLKLHNCGTAYGWGGFTPEQALYLKIDTTKFPTNKITKMILSQVPIASNAFWSITVYDKDGFSDGNKSYNINSAFAIPDDDDITGQTYTIYFGESMKQFVEQQEKSKQEKKINFLEIYPDWTGNLRLYLPTDEALNGKWQMPAMELA